MDTIMPPSEAAAATDVAEDRTVAILGYVTIFGFIAAIVLHLNHKTRLGAYHLRQMLGLGLSAVAGAIVALVPILGWLAWCVIAIGITILWVMGLVSAIRGDMRPVPLVGEHFQRWFAGVFD
jgi:uncharacterized membrane protein